MVKVGQEWCRGGEIFKVCAGSVSCEAAFRLRLGSAGLLEVKKRCEMCIDESGAGEDVEHLLVTCWEYERDRWVLADESCRG